MRSGKIKYIFVTGGVLSGLGKGVVTASIGNLIASQGFKVTAVKIDPYINLDAGTMRPTEHGEVWVTDDGGETDQDLGNYERFMDTDISRDHNITTGQVYAKVIQSERNLEYGGKCVEVIPHIPNEVIRRIKDAGKAENADFVVVEIGGTVGDYQNVLFLEAARQMKYSGEKIAFVHVVYLPIPNNIGEMKTKPAQNSVRQLLGTGIQPDFIICRAQKAIDNVRKEKIALFCNVPKDNIISAPNLKYIYESPIKFDEQSITTKLLAMFGHERKDTKKLEEWKSFVAKIKSAKKKIKIGIVGKYFDIGDFTLDDSYISVIESVKHAAWNNGCEPEIVWINSKKYEEDSSSLSELSSLNGVIVPGGFGSSGVEGKIMAIRYCRENKIPFLGLCLGLQLAVVEFSRNVCGLSGAHTTEIDPKTKYPVICILPEQQKNIDECNYGATMRLGACKAVLKKGSQVYKLYGKENVSERHRHRYEVNPEFIETIEKKGLVFSGRSPDRKLMEFIELPGHPYFVATQAHPEFKSRPLSPAPLFDGLVKAGIRE